LIVDLDLVMIVAVVVILTGASIAFLLIFIHGWMLRIDRARFQNFAARVRPRLMKAIQVPGADEALVGALMEASLAHRARLLSQAGSLVRGEQRDRVTRLAHRCGVIDQARRDTESHRWWVRLQGVRTLSAVGGGHDVVPGLLADTHVLVRSEAALWCGQHPSQKNIERLLNLMDTPTMADRSAVVDALVSIGPPAVGPLAKRIPDCTSEGRQAGLTAALGLGDPVFLPVAMKCLEDEDEKVRIRAARLLSILGGEEAVQGLIRVLDDPGPRVRAAAARGLGRLEAWSAAGALESLLADPHPDPRRDAALALGDVGPAGWLILRETARMGGPAGRLADAVLEAYWSPDDPGWTLAVGRRQPA
jgi:hypothetical protein